MVQKCLLIALPLNHVTCAMFSSLALLVHMSHGTFVRALYMLMRIPPLAASTERQLERYSTPNQGTIARHTSTKNIRAITHPKRGEVGAGVHPHLEISFVFETVCSSAPRPSHRRGCNQLLQELLEERRKE